MTYEGILNFMLSLQTSFIRPLENAGDTIL